ncbi:MAG: hypothetical protein M0P52_09395 [Rhodoferax sp.]|nr:hypothetical protein [Rhodoferax sp.]
MLPSNDRQEAMMANMEKRAPEFNLETAVGCTCQHPQGERHRSRQRLISCGLARDTKRSTAVSRFKD